MAVNKVVNKSTKSHGAMRNAIEYVLQDKKVKEGYVELTGPFNHDKITWDSVYNTFLDEKKLWDKDSGRMYAHNIISFHKDEKISPEECLEIGKNFVEKFFPNHQNLICVHQDRDHLHVHILTNSVSYIDGRKLHQNKRDLDKQKTFTNEICLERGLSVATKGQHFDGSAIEEGHVTAWNKDKYNLLRNEKKSFVADCAIAVLESKETCTSKEEFIQNMEERGWHTTWVDNKKHITFENDNGEKVRGSNLEKSFQISATKEGLTHEFERQTALRTDRERRKQLDKYYNEIITAISGTGSNTETIGNNTEVADGTYRKKSEDTDALIRDVRTDISNNKLKNRAVRDTENESVAIDEQSHTRESERRLEEQQRSENEGRIEQDSIRKPDYKGPKL